ncbi:MAG: hypothetical protein IPP02_14765 [Chitinophagaceae bacterium]|nr:hypothetical protein [Chitinophagaceae bacterium]HQW44019.1 DUF6263 family protein [Chitinophagaceae bacterium]
MKQILTTAFFILCISSIALAQKTTGKLLFEQGQTLEITLQSKTTISQQAMGQAIDFNVDASGTHAYKVTNTTEDNHTLNHTVKRITFSFDGMGQKQSFDSDKPKDLNGQFGKPIKEMLDKKYDMIIDPAGNVKMAMPESFTSAQADSRMAIITSMMKEVVDIVQPPQKGKASFFKVLPGNEAGKGDAWTTSYIANGGKVDAAYVIGDINDSTIVVDFAENSVTVTKAEMMGSETTTTMNNKSTGKIILDRVTGIMREKTINTESNGNTEASFGTLPVTSKTTTVIIVKPVQ